MLKPCFSGAFPILEGPSICVIQIIDLKIGLVLHC
jgi:hypothetical protein